MIQKILTALLFVVISLSVTACSSNEAKPSSTNSSSTKTQLQSILDSGKLILGTSGNMTPMTRSLDNGSTAVGFDVDLAKTMADTMGVELIVKVIAFDKLIPALTNGEVDIVISNMTITPKRNTQVVFVGPYLKSGKCLITKVDTLASAKKEELNKSAHKMVVIKGSTSEKFIQIAMPNVETISTESQDEAVAMVRNSEVVAMLSEYPMCKSIITSNPDDKFISVFSNLTYEPIGIAIAPQNTHLVNYSENFLVRAHHVGLLEVLAKKWFK